MVFKKLIKFLKKNKKTKPNKNTPKKKLTKKRISVKSSPMKKTGVVLKSSVIKKEKLIAVAIHYFSKLKVAIIKLKGTLKVNDTIHIKGFTSDFKQTVASMQIDHEPVKVAKKGQEIGIKVKGKVRHRDKVYTFAA
jgi:putative protease